MAGLIAVLDPKPNASILLAGTFGGVPTLLAGDLRPGASLRQDGVMWIGSTVAFFDDLKGAPVGSLTLVDAVSLTRVATWGAIQAGKYSAGDHLGIGCTIHTLVIPRGGECRWLAPVADDVLGPPVVAAEKVEGL